MHSHIPVITFDGPSGSGKGTISQLLAQKLGWHFLDSGALYRVLALAAQQRGIHFEDERVLGALAKDLEVKFILNEKDASSKIMLEDEEVSDAIRSENCSRAASIISALPEVRQNLLERQRAFRKEPGLVTDGRDMGTIVFPDATIKFFLTASLQERAERRYNQLKTKGINVSLSEVLNELEKRDFRDQHRAVSPLIPAQDAILIDTTAVSINEVMKKIEGCLPKYLL